MSLAMSLRSRGPAGSAARTAAVLSRFGVTAAGMAGRLDRYMRLLSDLGVRPTWPTTACVLARHPALLRGYADRGAELALHGLVHGDHAVLDRRRQRETIAKAAEIFSRAGIAAVGFRGPYLRYNDATLDVLKELGFRWHSSQAVAFPMLASDPAQARVASYGLALRLYSAHDAASVAARPRLRDGLVDIPVAIPDDETMVERLRLEGADAGAQWVHMLDRTHERGDLFTIQLHPERIRELDGALRETLTAARRREPAVFVARLDEIAEWWRRRSRFSVQVLRAGDGRYRVRLDADDDVTLLVRGCNVEAAPWYGNDAVAHGRDLEVRSARVPVMGVSRRSPAAVGALLAEEGLPVEVSDARDAYGGYVDVGAEWRESEVLDAIDRAPGPLVRIWRWPRGMRSALAVTGDIDALTLRDFLLRSWETRASAQAGRHRS